MSVRPSVRDAFVVHVEHINQDEEEKVFIDMGNKAPTPEIIEIWKERQIKSNININDDDKRHPLQTASLMMEASIVNDYVLSLSLSLFLSLWISI